MADSDVPCRACGGPTRETDEPWAVRCRACGTFASTLAGRPVTRPLDEVSRCSGLMDIRVDNFERVLDALATVRDLRGARVLDVGAAHGWFVEAARRRGAQATGIEPDPVVAAIATGRGVPVRVGWFPDDLPSGEAYDVISFNDVFEHLPDPDQVIDQCLERLRPGGCVVVNLPDVDGLGFRVSRLLRRVGVRGPYERLWQVGFPSPHLWYFSRRGLASLLGRHGMRAAYVGSLPSLTRRGLWQRVHFDRRPSPASIAQWALLWLLVPVFNRPATSDAILLIAVVRDGTEGPAATGTRADLSGTRSLSDPR
jgi:SAM-dependent methyltransferase